AGQLLVNRLRVASLDEVGFVAHTFEELLQFVPGNTGEEAGVGNLVPVQVKDRENATVPGWIEELVAMPAGGQRPGLGLAVADDAGDDEVGVVESGPESVTQSVAQLAALVNATRSFGSDVAGNAAGEAELLEQLLHALDILADVRVHLAVGAFQVGVGHQRRTAVPRANDVNHVQIITLDDPIQMHVEHVQARRRAPVTEQSRLDVLTLEWLFQQRVVEQVNLADRQIVGRPPVSIHLAQLLGSERTGRRGLAALSDLAFCVGDSGYHGSSFLVHEAARWLILTRRFGYDPASRGSAASGRTCHDVLSYTHLGQAVSWC